MAKQREIITELRQLIVKYHNMGLGYKKISKRLLIPRSTVASIVQKYKKTGNIANKKGQGRKKKTTERIDRAIVRKILANRRQSAVKIAYEIQNEFNVNLHPQTIRNRINSKGYSGRIAVKKPFISAKNKRIRLQWAKDKINWSLDQWKHVIWSDETKILLFGSDGVIRTWRKANEKYKAECLRATIKHGGGKLHSQLGYLIFYKMFDFGRRTNVLGFNVMGRMW